MSHEEEDLDDLLNSALEDFRRGERRAGSGPPRTPPSQRSLVPASLDSPRASPSSSASTAASYAGAAARDNPECDVPRTRAGGAQSSAEGFSGSGQQQEVKGLGGLGLPARKPGKGRSKTAVTSAHPSGSTGEEEHLAAQGGRGSEESGGSVQLKSRGGTESGGGGSREGTSSGASEAGGNRRKDLRATLEQLAARTKKTVEGMRQAERESGSGDVGAELPGGGEEGEEEEMVERLVKQFEEMGSHDIQGLMDTMLQQLLSKEVLYEPMVEIRDRYPAWLSANAEKLSEEDRGRYSRQYGCIRQLCQLYESRPGDHAAVVSLMTEMQECGQPPADIIRELAPGLEIGDDGLPQLPDLSSGDLPANCSVM